MSVNPVPSLSVAIHAENVLLDIAAEDRASVIRDLLDSLVRTERLTKPQATAALRLINERESLGSTAIGGGVALPHARVGHAEEVLCAFGLLKKGSGFNALDGAPVRYVFLILSPKSDDALHIGFLKSITRFTTVSAHLKALSGCKTAEEVIGVFRDYA